ncbi:Thioredoxin-1 [Candidatus Arsenophonus lipoptenae]|uniref:Thioredoxin n=1 Tax=Candidatus Arsenophonus lipoptenae TaxID=634113 RepID=A0A0X9W7F3_9GAMM|nr:thioredoxin TrxA [Candidatus Arsenophonus lipoptenae]AMA65197.1 Thioredoxin-1 [Candidatus Arsenophonus lipoptenae]
MNNKIIHFSDEDFNIKILNETKPILIDFWAEWCNPCKMITPILSEIADEYKSQLIVGKLNIDKNPKTATKYNIRSIPTLILFKNSEEISRQVGLLSKTQLKEFLDKNI